MVDHKITYFFIITEIAKNVVNDLIEYNLKPCIAETIIEDRDAFWSDIPAFVSQELKIHAPKIITELFKEYVQSNVIHVHPTTISSTLIDSSVDLQYQLYLKMKRSLQDRADNITLWEALSRKFEKSSTFNTSCREDDFHSHHDEHQDDDAPPKGEKKVKRIKKPKRSKSARGSSSKHSRKDFTTYVSKQQSQHQEWNAWEEENVVDEDEVIPEDVTPKNAEEYACHLEQSTSFMENQIVWESRQQDIPHLFFLKYGNTKEKKYYLSLHKIHAEEFPEPDLEEKLNRWVRKEFKTFNEDARLSIQHWKDSWHKRVYKQNQKKVRKNPKDYYSNNRITKVVRIVTDQPLKIGFYGTNSCDESQR
ncbi:hypothetical protein Tco_1267397 [Tanacetum coccineum]